MDRLHDAVYNQVVRCHDGLEKKLFSVGKLIDHYVEKQAPRRKYMYEIILGLPVIFLLHQWCLISPYSNYKIINVLMFVVWLAGMLFLPGTWHLNIRTRMLTFLWLGTDIIMAWFTAVIYWTYQQETSETCLEDTDVMIWTDITENFTSPVILTAMIRCVYHYTRLAVISKRTGEVFQTWVYTALLGLAVTPDILCVANIFPLLVSELSYWLHIAFIVSVFIFETLLAQHHDIDITQQKIDELRALASNEADVELKTRYVTTANTLHQNLMYRRMGDYGHLRDLIPGQWFIRDSGAVSALCYIGFALTTEFVRNGDSVYEFLNIDYVITVLGLWCTSFVTLLAFSSLLTCVANLCIGFAFFFLTTETHMWEMMNINAGSVIYVTTLLLFSESDLLHLANAEKADAMKLVVMFSLYIVIFQSMGIVENKVLSVVNAGAVQDTSFYLRFGIIIGLFITVPTLATYQISRNLHTDFLPLFFASSNFNLVIVIVSLLIQCIIVSLKWHAVRYANTIESCVNYLHRTKAVLLTIACLLQAYYRFMCPFFQAWWLYRLFLISFGAVVSISFVLYLEWERYKKCHRLLALMDNFADVNYERVNDDDEETRECIICYSELVQGKVLPCMHAFHLDCLKHWLQVRQVCPVCNTNV